MKSLLRFIQIDIWRFRVRALPFWQGLPVRILRIFIISIKEFHSDKCQLRASALTFYSLLSIVPVFAMAFGIAKGFGMDKMLQEKLLESAETQQEVMTRVIEFSQAMLNNTRGGVIAGIGIVILLWTVIKVLANIERSFNDIWGVRKERDLGRKLADYLSLMFICPIVVILSSSLTVFLASQVTMLLEHFSFLGVFAPVILKALSILPYAILWILLTYLYMFMPNAHIRFTSALIGGVVAGTLYQLVQWGYVHFQIGASKSGAVYGSFAALPLFLMWLQTSWLVILYGAELAFAHQNENTYEYEPDCLNVSEKFKKILAGRIVESVLSRLKEGKDAVTAEELTDGLKIPVRLIREVLDRMVAARILSIVEAQAGKASGYLPARPTEEMTFRHTVDLLDQAGLQELPFGNDEDFERLRRQWPVIHQKS